jgi:hypothetical protein
VFNWLDAGIHVSRTVIGSNERLACACAVQCPRSDHVPRVNRRRRTARQRRMHGVAATTEYLGATGRDILAATPQRDRQVRERKHLVYRGHTAWSILIRTQLAR